MGKRMRVAVIGGGIGGLALAQALHKAGVEAGVEVAVYEREHARTDRLQGYRIHINPSGARALRECLPEPLWETFLATTGKSGGRFGFLTEKLEELLVIGDEQPAEPDPGRSHHSVSRITLRQVLSSGLDGILHHGKEFVRYERGGDGTITCHFADGTTAEADVVVAADGGGSRLRRQYLPHAERVDTGVQAVAGKLTLTAETRKWLPERLADGPILLLPPRGVGMFLAPHDLDDAPVAARAIGGNDETFEHDSVLFDNTTSYLMWAFAASPGRYPVGARLSQMDGEELRGMVGEMISGWHPALRRMVADSEPGTVSLLPIRSAVPVGPWPSSTITLIGDAIHSMTPMQGVGANVALRDAQLLGRNLIAAARGEREVVDAIADYEGHMREYGFKAVRASMRSAQQFVGENAVARFMFASVLRFLRKFPALKRRVFGRFGDA
jgi:salicylate hydroxylase